MEPDGLQSLRKEILVALEKSIIEFTTEAELAPTHRHDGNTAIRVNLVIQNGQKALRDLTAFFSNVQRYSGKPIERYIWISCIFRDSDSVTTRCSHTETLEQFWCEREVVKWIDRPENIFCIFARSDRIHPESDALKKVGKVFHRELPSTEAVCRSAVVALLFLLRGYLHLTAPDLYYLMLESLGHQDAHTGAQLLCDLSEEDLCLDTDAKTPWHSINSATVRPTAFSRSSTKILTLPGRLPEYQTAYSYMDIYQPHSSQPVAHSTCAIWGGWKDQGSWRSVAAFSNREVAELYWKCLQGGKTSPSALPSLLSSHWINLLRCVYKIGVNDGRLILRNAAKDMETIRYRNSAKPSIASANVCLMYFNHFEYFRRMTKALCEEMESYPPQWRCPAPGEMFPPSWIQEISGECETLHKEVLVLRDEATDIRKLILEQHNLLESRTTSLLTVLASIFVPMTFVASFFGMNTQEINGSSWQLKWYFIAAIPLAVLTILLPLIALPAFAFFLRQYAAHSTLGPILHWSWIIVTLALNLNLDLLPVGSSSLSLLTSIGSLTLLVFLRLLFFLPSISRGLPRGFPLGFYTHRLSEETKWQLMLAILFVVCFITKLSLLLSGVPFVELPFYLIYFFLVWYRHRRQKKSTTKNV